MIIYSIILKFYIDFVSRIVGLNEDTIIDVKVTFRYNATNI